MRRLLLVVLLLAGPAVAAERLDLTTPVTTPSGTSWKPDELHLHRQEQVIRAVFLGPAGERKACVWTGAAATTLMTTLNKANLTANTLDKRMLNQAVTDGCLTAGTVSGSPD